MTNSKIVEWWTYIISGIVLLGFLAPAMISAADTIIVVLGLILLVLYGLWSYTFWVKPLFNLIKEEYREP